MLLLYVCMCVYVGMDAFNRSCIIKHASMILLLGLFTLTLCTINGVDKSYRIALAL